MLVDEVDAGLVEAAYGGWQAGWRTQRDQGQISLHFLDVNESEIGVTELPFFFSNHTWVEQAGQAAVPPGTRAMRFQFEGVRLDGSNNDAFLDAAYLRLSLIPEPSSGWLMMSLWSAFAAWGRRRVAGAKQ